MNTLNEHKSNDFSRFYQQLPGAMVLELENARLARTLADIHGQYALQILGPPDCYMLKHSSIKEKIQLFDQRDVSDASYSVVADLTELPFMPSSMDLIVMPHVLEFAEHPKQLLSQCYQMLAPFGHMVVFSFVPFSAFGLRRLLGKRQSMPWCGQFYSPSRLDYWCEAIGFSVVKRHHLCFHWPTQSPFWAKYDFVFEIVGQFCWSNLGSVYMQVVQKQISTMTPIKASWWAKKTLPASGCRA